LLFCKIPINSHYSFFQGWKFELSNTSIEVKYHSTLSGLALRCQIIILISFQNPLQLQKSWFMEFLAIKYKWLLWHVLFTLNN
jgi:hypothetical protein